MASSKTTLKPLNLSSDLSKEYIERAVREHFDNDEVQVLSFDVTTPTERQGFLSEIVFLKVKYTTSSDKPEESLNLVAKFLPLQEEIVALMRLSNLHGREVEAYRYLNSPLPKSVCVGLDKSPVVPFLIAAASSEDAVTLIMEDLRARGYRTKSSIEGSSVEQTLAVFRSIALVHAVGVIDMERSGRIGSIIAINPREFGNDFLQSNIKILLQMFKGTPDEEVFRKIGENSDLLLEMAETFKFITTFIHSDLWAGNALLDADDRNCAIIDWQFGCLGNLVYDLQTMLFMSSDLKILEERDLLIKVLNEYWSSFTVTLSNHGVTLKKTFHDLEHCVTDTFLYGYTFMIASTESLLACNKTSKERIARTTAFLRSSGAWDKFVAMCAR
ncbi:Protein of unknown function DUF227 [Trinorchestia longiramus]|nr:Protein of unknown function DUF227 [Trinorchestia longiramus]